MPTPFDPTWPPTNAELVSTPFRNNFNALNEKIDAVPSGGVTDGQLSDAINSTPRNVDGITPLYITISDPPNPAPA